MENTAIRKEMVYFVYVLTDGSRYIYRRADGKFAPTSSEVMADKFTKKQAEGILKCSLPKALRGIFRAERCDDKEACVKEVKEKTLKEIPKATEDQNIKRWIMKIETLNGLVDEATKRKDELYEKLSDVDQELSDLAHYCEAQNLNAAEGYKAYKMIHDARVRRRSIKNELSVVTIICKNTNKDEIVNIINSLNNVTYKPRKLNGLFDL